MQYINELFDYMKRMNNELVKNSRDEFLDNAKIEYKYDITSQTHYYVIRIYKKKLDGEKQFPFVYAPKGISTTHESALDIALKEKWSLIMNAGVGNLDKGYALGQLVENGYIIQAVNATIAACRPLVIDTNGDLSEAEAYSDPAELVKKGAVSVVLGFMALVKDFKAVPQSQWVSGKGTESFNEKCQRQIIGQYANGDYFILTCDGRNYNNSPGFSMFDTQRICTENGVKFAYMLDGGGSTETVVEKKQLNNIYEGTTGRHVYSYIVFNGKDTIGLPEKKKSYIGLYCSKGSPALKPTIDYFLGDTLDLSTIKFFALYSDGEKKDVTSKVSIDKSAVKMGTVGKYKVNISYTENGISFTTNIYINVIKRAPTLSSISATKTKTTYTVGDTLNTKDIVVTAKYSDNSTKTISTAIINSSSVNMNVAGDYTISISYTEQNTTKTCIINIKVNEAIVEPEPEPEPQPQPNPEPSDIPPYEWATSYLIHVDQKSHTIDYVGHNDNRCTLITHIPNDAYVKHSERPFDGYLLPIPSDATKVTVSTPNAYPSIMLFNSNIEYVVANGFKNTSINNEEFNAGQYSYLAVNVKMPDNSNFPSNLDTSNWIVTFESAQQVPVVNNLVSISASKTKMEYFVGDDFSLDDVVVTATYTNGEKKDVTNKATISHNVKMDTAGKYNISVSYSENDVTKNVTLQVSVNKIIVEAPYDWHLHYAVSIDQKTRKPNYFVHAENRATGITQQVNNAYLKHMERDFEGYLLPIPDNATKMTVNTPNCYPSIVLYNDKVEYQVANGFKTANEACETFSPGQYSYASVNVKKSDNSNFDANYDTSSWKIKFE